MHYIAHDLCLPFAWLYRVVNKGSVFPMYANCKATFVRKTYRIFLPYRKQRILCQHCKCLGITKILVLRVYYKFFASSATISMLSLNLFLQRYPFSKKLELELIIKAYQMI